jgi:hypothetical protein
MRPILEALAKVFYTALLGNLKTIVKRIVNPSTYEVINSGKDSLEKVCEKLISIWSNCFHGELWLLSHVHSVERGLFQLFMDLSRSAPHVAVYGMSLGEAEEPLGEDMGAEGQGQQKHMLPHKLD